jgi:hypothetical protein
MVLGEPPAASRRPSGYPLQPLRGQARFGASASIPLAAARKRSRIYRRV